jgi:hypothetical protein
MREGYGKGFEEWAKIENLKRSAKTLIYIQDARINSYEELEQKCKDTCVYDKMISVSDRIKSIEIKQNRINEFQKQIGTYGKTRAVYNAYKDIKNPKKKTEFYETHRADITLHKAAKKYFDEYGLKKLPSINQLKEQWSELEKKRRTLYSDYKQKKKIFSDLCNAKSNARKMLKIEKTHETLRGHGAEL